MGDKLFSLALLAVFCGLQYRLWAGESSVAYVQDLRADITRQEHINAGLRDRNQRLERQIISLKNDPQAIEQRARMELGMIKQGETFYVFVDDE